MTRHFLPALLLATLLYGIAPPAVQAQSVVSPPDVRTLKPGEFLWYPQIAPEGPVVLVVSLDEQRAYVYRNGIAIGVSTISSGKAGKETPTGVFTILQKNKDHRSNLYNDAPMPYMQRLTWDGIALHGGHLPGYPASHGCVRLPQAFAEKLFGITRFGDSVVVANARRRRPASCILRCWRRSSLAGRPRTRRCRPTRCTGTKPRRRKARSASWSACTTSACRCCATA